MNHSLSFGRFLAVAVSCAISLSLLSGCAEEKTPSETALPLISDGSLASEISLIAGSGRDWYAIENGNLVTWGEEHPGTGYSQRVIEFEGVQSVWGCRFGQLVLDEQGDLWTTGNSGHKAPITRNGWQFVLSDVVTASGNLWNGAAVCSDGSLWTWGKNDGGQLGNGTVSKDGTDTPPQHIMDGVRFIRGASYAVTQEGKLYGIGLWPGFLEPQLLCEGVSDVAAGSAEAIQILTPEGKLYLVTVPDWAGMPIQLPDTPTASDVSEIFDWGYRTEDGTCFLWNDEGSQAIRVDLEAVQIARNLDGFLIVTKDGTLVRGKRENGELTLSPLSDDHPNASSVEELYPVEAVPVSALTECFAIRADGTLVQLEESGSYTELLPDIAAVCAGQWATYAIDRTGMLWGMGGDTVSRMLGGDDVSGPSGFVRLLDGVASIVQYSESAVMVKRDGTLWAWGDTLGDESWREPMQIADQVRAAACEVYPGGLFIRNDHTLWQWRPVLQEDGTCHIQQTQLMEHVLDVCRWGDGFLVHKDDNTVWQYGENFSGHIGRCILSDVCSIDRRFLLQTNGTLWEVLASPGTEGECGLRQIADHVSFATWMYAWDCLLYLDQGGVLWSLDADGNEEQITDGIWLPT